MVEFLQVNFVPVLFVGLLVFLMMGFPVAFSLAATGLAYGFLGMELGLIPDVLFQALPLRVAGIMGNETLLAIPFFTLMGIILERSRMAEELLETVAQVFRSGSRRFGSCSRAGGGVARCHYGCGRCGGDFDGPYFAAYHAALRLQPNHRHRHHHCVRDVGPSAATFAGFDRVG